MQDSMAINSFNNQPIPATQQQKRKETTQTVATGVGATGGFAASARTYATKRGLNAAKGEKTLEMMLEATQNVTQTASQNTEVARGLWATFRRNVKVFSNDFLLQVAKFKNSKFIGPIIKSPLTKKVAGAFGGAMAFFVLVTGVNEACENGSLAVGDLKHKLNYIAG